MFELIIRTNSIRKTIQTSITTTPAAVFKELGVNTGTSMVNMDGMTLRGADINKTFADLGITAGATVNLNAIVKADGANA